MRKKGFYFTLFLVSLFTAVFLSSAGGDCGAKLIFVTPAEDTAGAIRMLIDRFNATHHDLQVEHKILSWTTDDCRNFYVTAFLSQDNSFDVFSGDIIWIAEFASAHWIEPLDAFFTREKQREFLPGPLKGCTYAEHIWAVPWFTDAGVLFYRKDLIEKPPATWRDLIGAAREKVEKGLVKYGYVFQGNQYEGLVCQVLELIWSNNGRILMDGNKVLLDTAESVEALGILADLVGSGLCPPDVIWYQEEDSRLFFQDGNALFLRNWPYAWSLMNQEGSRVKGKIGIAPLPVGPRVKITEDYAGGGSGCLGGWNLMLNRYSGKKKGGWELIEYLTGIEAQKVNAMVGGRLPTKTAVYHDREVLERNPYYSELYPYFLAAKPRPVSPFYPALSESMQVNFHKALTGVISPEAAIASIKKEMRKLLRE